MATNDEKEDCAGHARASGMPANNGFYRTESRDNDATLTASKSNHFATTTAPGASTMGLPHHQHQISGFHQQAQASTNMGTNIRRIIPQKAHKSSSTHKTALATNESDVEQRQNNKPHAEARNKLHEILRKKNFRIQKE